MCKFICKYVQSHLRACSVNCRCGDATKVPYCTICPGTLICKLQIVSQNEATLQGAVSREYAKQDEIRPQNFGSMSCRDAMMPRHQFTHVCVLTFGACEAQTSVTIMFEFEQIFRSCCTCPWHTYIYIYSSSRPSLSFVLPGLCKVLICCMGWPQRFGWMTTTMICSRCIFLRSIYWVGTSGVESARSVYI